MLGFPLKKQNPVSANNFKSDFTIKSSVYKGEIKGEVLVEGKNINEYGGELSQKIGFVFQNPFTQISGVKDTVFEEVAYGLENFGVPVEEIERRVIEVMKMTNMNHWQRRIRLNYLVDKCRELRLRQL